MVEFKIFSTHSSSLVDDTKISLTNAEFVSIASDNSLKSHVISVLPLDPDARVDISVKAGAFADTTYGISNKSTLEGTSYVFNDIQLPENIFDVGDQHGLSDLSGPSRYSLYDKVEFDGASYYYLSHAESSRTYRDFADVKSEVLRGAFKLELPGKSN